MYSQVHFALRLYIKQTVKRRTYMNILYIHDREKRERREQLLRQKKQQSEKNTSFRAAFRDRRQLSVPHVNQTTELDCILSLFSVHLVTKAAQQGY